MRRYEYRIVIIPMVDAEQHLNKLGGEGWRIVETIDRLFAGVRWLMEREISDG